jgi:hypothetical protein
MARYDPKRPGRFLARMAGAPVPVYQDRSKVSPIVMSVSDRVPPPVYHEQGPLPEPRFDGQGRVPPPVYEKRR